MVFYGKNTPWWNYLPPAGHLNCAHVVIMNQSAVLYAHVFGGCVFSLGMSVPCIKHICGVSQTIRSYRVSGVSSCTSQTTLKPDSLTIVSMAAYCYVILVSFAGTFFVLCQLSLGGKCSLWSQTVTADNCSVGT